MSDDSTKTLTLAELPELRRKTEAISRFLRGQIAAHLDTLRPLLAPERILGKYAGGKADVPGAERAFTELQQGYRPFTRKPYDLPEILDSNWLTLVGNAVELHSCEYVHPVRGKPVTISSPVRWVVNYRANYTLGQVKSVLAGKESVRPDHLRQFVINALVLQLSLARNPGLEKLFQDLRYELDTENPPELKGLPVVTIASCLASFRPDDELIHASTAFSGIPAFIELVNLNEVKNPKDALRENLDELLK